MAGNETRDEALHQELERRIAILESTDESAFGDLKRIDWIVLIMLGVVLPVILALAAR